MRSSLVMPTWNAGPLLEEVLAAVNALEGVTFDEKVAIDSGSTDGTVERLRDAGFRVIGIPQSEFDHGATRDRGIRETTGDVIVLLVQDATLLGADWLAKMVAPFDDPDVAGVWCRQIPRQGCQPVLDRRIRGWPGRGEVLSKKQLEPGQQLSDLKPMDQLLTCAFDNVASAVRRTVWERFPLGPRRFGEDIHFGKRVIEAGLAIAHQGEAAVIHSHDRSAWSEGKRTFCDHRNLHRLFGLVGIPTRAAVRRAIVDSTAEHVAYVKSLGLPPEEEAPALEWTRAYCRWQCWGQYLGAKAGADPKGLKGVFFRWLGRRLERGIG
ncbi:MAG: glycosyltransferase family 2 protein [Planctomycetes bacterium]|nr:glycosyltransferase family 2 protein [Planctomycetota bacterium]